MCEKARSRSPGDVICLKGKAASLVQASMSAAFSINRCWLSSGPHSASWWAAQHWLPSGNSLQCSRRHGAASGNSIALHNQSSISQH